MSATPGGGATVVMSATNCFTTYRKATNRNTSGMKYGDRCTWTAYANHLHNTFPKGSEVSCIFKYVFCRTHLPVSNYVFCRIHIVDTNYVSCRIHFVDTNYVYGSYTSRGHELRFLAMYQIVITIYLAYPLYKSELMDAKIQ